MKSLRENVLRIEVGEELEGDRAVPLGLRLSAPFVLFGLVFYIGAGVLNRLMPQAQVFFMLMPANLFLGLMLLMLMTGLLMSTFLGAFESHLAQFLR